MAQLEDADVHKLQQALTSWGIEANIKTEEDVKQLLTSGKLASRSIKVEHEEHMEYSRPIPKLPVFSGKGDTPYELWKYDLKCLQSSNLYTETVVSEAIRRSLKGEAAMVMVRMGDASVSQLLHKLDGYFGNVATEGACLTQFFASQQSEDEDVTTWACRLEGLIQKVHAEEMISKSAMDEMLRTKLWSGLYDERLKQTTRHIYDSVKEVDDLVQKLRSMEMEMKKGTKGEKTKAKTQSVQQTDEKCFKLLQNLTEKMENMEKEIKTLKEEKDSGARGYEQGRTYNGGRGSHRGFRGRGGRRGRGRWQKQDDQQDSQRAEQSPKSGKDEDIECYRCKQKGHIALGCRVRTDHLKGQ